MPRSRRREPRSVYRLVNHDLREIYVGVSRAPVERLGAHCAGRTKAVEHWSCDQDEIDFEVVSTGLTQRTASRVAHHIERHDPFEGFEGYKVHLTGGT